MIDTAGTPATTAWWSTTTGITIGTTTGMMIGTGIGMTIDTTTGMTIGTVIGTTIITGVEIPGGGAAGSGSRFIDTTDATTGPGSGRPAGR